MIIIFIIDTLEIGGAEKSLLEITSRFTKYKPVFIHLFSGDALKRQLEDKGINVISLNLKPDYKFRMMAKEVKKVLSDTEITLIHSTLFRSDQVARIVSKDLNIPLVNSLVNNSYAKIRYNRMSFIESFKLKIIEFIDRRSSKQVNLFISNSHAIKHSNAKALNIPKDKIKVIFRGREIHLFNKRRDLDTLKDELGLKNEKVLLNVSRLLERKGQIELIEAFSRYVGERNDKSVLIIAGEGQYRPVLEKRIKELKIAARVKLLGNRSDIVDLLHLADFFIFPSHYEGLPGALIEAMMSKTPIIASNIPENLECVNEQNSLLFPVGNIDALYEAIKDAQNLDWFSKVERNYQFAIDYFDIDKVARQYESTYDDLLGEKK
jgi:glycosyltransferase involved in cell wall biosynthesis